MKIRITRIDKALPMPAYHTEGAVAFDLYSRLDETIGPKERALLQSNFIVEVPKDHTLVVVPRSSTPKRGIMFPHSIGIIDQDYHGPEDELKILVMNYTDEPVNVKRGDRIAQALIIPVMKAEFIEVEKIKDESRGGFGSTG